MDVRNTISSMMESMDEGALDAPTPSPAAIATEHGVALVNVLAQAIKGIEEEMEHTSDEAVAYEIALDHLSEDPQYYEKEREPSTEGNEPPDGDNNYTKDGDVVSDPEVDVAPEVDDQNDPDEKDKQDKDNDLYEDRSGETETKPSDDD